MRPAFVIGNFKVEKFSVTRIRFEELRMVFVRIENGLIFPKTFILGIVILYERGPSPSFLAFYSKMVACFFGQFAVSRRRLQNSLSHFNGSWNLILLHFADGNVFILLNIFGCTALFLRGKGIPQESNEKEGQKSFAHTTNIRKGISQSFPKTITYKRCKVEYQLN